MSVTCHYHAVVPARWRCAQCDFTLCSQCVPPAPGVDTPPCPSCRTPLMSLGLANAIKPFWQRTGRFFTYPAQGEILLSISVLSLLGMLWIIPGIGRIVSLLVAVASVKLCYQVLLHTALGNLEAPKLGQKSEFESVFWQQIAVIVTLLGGAVFLGYLTESPVVMFMALILAAFLLPAAIMTLAIDGSFVAAINPVRLILTAAAIGKPYALLFFFLILFMGAEMEMFGLTAEMLPLWVNMFLHGFISLWFSVSMFHLMGYVVYQYHEELGFAAVKDFTESEEAKKEFARQGVAPPPDRVQMLVTEGKLDEALAELEAQLRLNPDDLALHERYSRVLVAHAGRKDTALEHSDFYIGRLLAASQRDKALDVYKRVVARWGALEIKDAGDAVALARHAHERREAKLALPMLARFGQRFPGHATIPEAQLLAARLMSETMGKDQMARQIVEQLRRSYPEHPLRPQMDAFAATLDRLIQRAAQRPAPSAGEVAGN